MLKLNFEYFSIKDCISGEMGRNDKIMELEVKNEQLNKIYKRQKGALDIEKRQLEMLVQMRQEKQRLIGSLRIFEEIIKENEIKLLKSISFNNSVLIN